MNGLVARFQADPKDLPQVESNLEESPQENPDDDGSGDLPLGEGCCVVI